MTAISTASSTIVDLLSGIAGLSNHSPKSPNLTFHTPNGKVPPEKEMSPTGCLINLADDTASVSLPTRSRSNSTSSSTETASVVHDAVDDLYGRLSVELLNSSVTDNGNNNMDADEAKSSTPKTVTPQPVFITIDNSNKVDDKVNSPNSSQVLPSSSSTNNNIIMSDVLAELRTLREDNERLQRQVQDLTSAKKSEKPHQHSLAMAIISNIAPRQTSDAESQASDDVAGSLQLTHKPNNSLVIGHPRTNTTVSCSACVETKKILSEVVHAVNTVRLEMEELKLGQRRMLDCFKAATFATMVSNNSNNNQHLSQSQPYPALVSTKAVSTSVASKPPPVISDASRPSQRSASGNRIDSIAKTNTDMIENALKNSEKISHSSSYLNGIGTSRPSSFGSTRPSPPAVMSAHSNKSESILSSSPVKASTPTKLSDTSGNSNLKPESWRPSSNLSSSVSNLLRNSYSARPESPTARKVTFQDPARPPSAIEAPPVTPPSAFANLSNRAQSRSPEGKSERQVVDEIILKYLGNRTGSPTMANANQRLWEDSSRRSPSPSNSVRGIMKARQSPASPSAVYQKLFAPQSMVFDNY